MSRYAGWAFVGFCGLALADWAAAQGIYTCVDRNGKRLTSDRPIAECVDREQKELNKSGTVRRTVGPNLTAAEQAAKDEQERRAAEDRAREAEEKRRDRALLARYPNQAAHDKERADAIAQVDQVIGAARRRIVELGQQRKKIDEEYEFYKRDPSKAPALLRRQLDDNEHSLAVQRRFILDQDAEKDRVNKRFDEELVQLKRLWAIQSAGVPAPAAASAPRR